jgi:hypothetical protein
VSAFANRPSVVACCAQENEQMDNRVPLSILFMVLVASVLPLAGALYLHGHMDFGAVLKHAIASAG